MAVIQKRGKQWARLLAMLLAVLGVGLRQTAVATPIGVQCPTAEVHTIAVPILTQCGCMVGIKHRTPRPGEKGFIQCQCKEKRAASESAPAPILLAVVPARLSFLFPQRPVGATTVGSDGDEVNASTPRLLRPPAV